MSIEDPTPEEVAEAMKHDLWSDFVAWAHEEDVNISLTYPGDWYPWWNCFLTGAEAASAIE